MTEQEKQLEEIFNCPNMANCRNEGVEVGGYVDAFGDHVPEPIQCQFCYEHPKSVFNYMQKVKVSNFNPHDVGVIS